MSEEKNTANSDSALAEEIAARRSKTVEEFSFDFSVDDIPDVETQYEPVPVAEPQVINEVPEPIIKVVPEKKSGGCLVKLLYAFLILGIAGLLASVLLLYTLDSMAINRPKKQVDVVIPTGANTQMIADILVENELIDYAFCFRIYAKISGIDGLWQQGSFALSPDMGYDALAETLQTMTPRETVMVTIPEGKTVEEIAKMLKQYGVCETEDFYNAVQYGDFDYDFITQIPTEDDGQEFAGRVYRLEGYLFPDTYDFYVGSSGEAVVRRMLDNFNNKLTSEIRQQIADRNWTIDQAIIVASLVEGEAASKEDMEKVSKVLQNRMDPKSGYPKLELCSTRDYVNALSPTMRDIVIDKDTKLSYNTYDRTGLPVGAINNPGLQALMAALNPSMAKEMEKCYFFATDYNTGITYFSQTFSEHERICRKYKIGMYG